MDTIAERIKYYCKLKGLKLKALAEKLSMEDNSFRMALSRNSLKEYSIDKIVEEYGVSKHWLLTGEGDMEIEKFDGFTIERAPASKNVDSMSVNEPFVMDTYNNKNGNRFLKLRNNEYVMFMPLAEINAQAGFLDHYQDVEMLSDMKQHSISVERPMHGRYVAFRVEGYSMDDGTSNAILKDSIVSTRELQRHLWQSKLRIKDFPFWVIYTSRSPYPLVKEIIDHDLESGTITCHSLNDSPEFTDFTISLNDVQGLFYVVHVQKDINPNKEYEL